MTQSATTIHELNLNHAEQFQKLRLKGLQEEPQAFTATYEESAALPLSEFEPYLSSDENGFVLGAFSADTLVGMTGFRRYAEGAKVAHKGVIWGVYLLPQYRGQGIARLLLQAVIERARQLKGIELIHLGVNPANQPVVKLYESLGFSRWGSEQHALKVNGVYVDEDQMVLWL